MGDKGPNYLEELYLSKEASVDFETGETFNGSGRDVAEFIRLHPDAKWTKITFKPTAAP